MTKSPAAAERGIKEQQDYNIAQDQSECGSAEPLRDRGCGKSSYRYRTKEGVAHLKSKKLHRSAKEHPAERGSRGKFPLFCPAEKWNGIV
jgi:hypothetical protein